MWADTGTVRSWKIHATTRTGHTHHVRSCSPMAASSRKSPSTCGFVAACMRLRRSGNRSRPIAAPRDMRAPTTMNTAEARSIQASGRKKSGFIGLDPPVCHEPGYGHGTDEPDDGDGHHQHQVVQVPVHRHIDAQRPGKDCEQHVGSQHPVQQRRATGDPDDGTGGRQRENDGCDSQDNGHHAPASIRTSSSSSAVPMMRIRPASMERTSFRRPSTSFLEVMLSACRYSVDVERSTSTTREPGIREITCPVAVTIRSWWLRSFTATTALVTLGPRTVARYRTWPLATTTFARKAKAKGTAYRMLNRPLSSTGGR